MTATIPCIRHGHASPCDPRLVEALAMVRCNGLPEIDAMLESLLDYDGQLWATWRTPADRDAGSVAFDRAWQELGGERGTRHLLRSEDGYDYQSDCMNDASN